MAKTRITIPKEIRERLLVEFNHRCARCGADRPQIHHIDENPSNNEPLNLIPLCPNCHLTDQHNPTNPIEPKKLSLFRKFKDPTVLRSEFHPLFVRLTFLDDALVAKSAEGLKERADDLVAFVEQLEMGSYYAKKIKELVGKPHEWEVSSLNIYSGNITPSSGYEDRKQKREQKYIQQLRAAYDPTHMLIIELLRFQKW
jgi:hypothetical protein